MSDPDKPDTPEAEAADAPEPSRSNPESTVPAAAPYIPASAEPAKPPPAPPRKPPTTRPSRAPYFLLLLIVLAGFGALIYHDLELKKSIDVVFGEYNRLQQSRNSDAAALATAQDEMRTQLQATVQEQLQAAQQAIEQSTNEQASAVDTLNRELVALRLRVNDSNTGAGSAWRLTEAASLLRFAQQRLVLGREARTALGLTVAADDLLAEINDPAVFTVREALALDISALQGVMEVDVAGLHARLGAAMEQVEDLSVQPSGPDAEFRAPPPSDASETVTDSWWSSAVDSLGQYFVVTREAEESLPQLSAEQTWVIRETIKLRLEQARVALLRGQARIYTSALDDAHTSISSLLQGERKTAVLDEIAALRDEPIQTVVPPANLGLQALRQLQPQGAAAP